MIIRAILFILLLIISNNAFSEKLKTGDLILLPLNCWVCSLIEEEENSIYSHIGVVVYENNKPFVYEAWGMVQKATLEEFISRAEKGEKPKYIRSKTFSNLSSTKLNSIEFELINIFTKKFEGLSYDRNFIWDNTDDSGKELYYCSEFVAKFLNPYLALKIEPKSMHFTRNRPYWRRYFQGKIPDNLPGLSPSDIEFHPEFIDIGEPELNIR